MWKNICFASLQPLLLHSTRHWKQWPWSVLTSTAGLSEKNTIIFHSQNSHSLRARTSGYHFLLTVFKAPWWPRPIYFCCTVHNGLHWWICEKTQTNCLMSWIFRATSALGSFFFKKIKWKKKTLSTHSFSQLPLLPFLHRRQIVDGGVFYHRQKDEDKTDPEVNVHCLDVRDARHRGVDPGDDGGHGQHCGDAWRERKQWLRTTVGITGL